MSKKIKGSYAWIFIIGIIFLNCMTITGEEIKSKKFWNNDNFEYDYIPINNSEGIMIKSILFEAWEEKVIEIPDSIYGRAVVSLQHSLFRENPVVEKVILPAGVTVLPEACFQNCKTLREVECKDLRSIEKHAFDGCISLEKIGNDAVINDGVLNFSSGCSYIGMEAFRNTLIKEVNISEPESASSPLRLEGKAFSGMKELRKVWINRECQIPEFTLKPKEACSGISIPFGVNEALEEVRFSKEFLWVYDWEWLYDWDGVNEKAGKRLPVKECCDSLKKQMSLPSLKRVILEGDCKTLVPVFAPDFELKILSDSIQNRTFSYIEYYDAWDWRHGHSVDAERLYSSDVLNWLQSCSVGIKSLVLGGNVSDLSGASFDSLEKISVLSSTPPPCGNAFSNNVYLNARLTVPVGSESAYRRADGWSKFKWINDTESSIEDISSGEISEVIYYDLTGRRVLNPKKGVYIVKDKSGTRKVIL